MGNAKNGLKKSMGRNFNAANIWIFVILSLCARVEPGKGRGQEVKDRVQGSFVKVKENVGTEELSIRREESQFQQPLTVNEETEVVDEDKVQRFDTLSAESVPDSLVEVVEETKQNEPGEAKHQQRNKNNFKPSVENKNSSLSMTTSKAYENNVHTVQTFPYQNIHDKAKVNLTNAHPSRVTIFKSMIVPRVSIPGKHRTLNTSHTRFNWNSLFSPLQFTSLKHKLMSKTNAANENNKLINQKERNDPNAYDVFSKFISRMGLDTPVNLGHVTPHMDVTQNKAPWLSSKNAHWNEKTTHRSKEKVLKNGVTNRGGSAIVIKGESKGLSDLPQTLGVSEGEHSKDMPFKKKEGVNQIKPEVYASIIDVKSKGQWEHKSNNVNGSLISSMTNRKAYSSGNAASHSIALKEPMKSQAAYVKTSNISLSIDRKGITLNNITRAGTMRPQLNDGKNRNKIPKFSGKTGKPHINVKLALLKNNEINNVAKVAQLTSNSASNKTLVISEGRKRLKNANESSKTATKDNSFSSRHSGKDRLHALRLVHTDKDTAEFDITNPSAKQIRGLNSTIARHMYDLIRFLNSFMYPSNDTNDFHNNKIHPNKTNRRNNARNKSEKHILENMQRLLNFIHVNKTYGNNTRKVLEMKNRPTVLSHFLTDSDQKRLQLSVFRGWNSANIRNEQRLKAGISKNRTSVKSDRMQFNTEKDMNEKGGQALELGLLQLMKNISRKELDNLRDYILKALNSIRLKNVSGEHQQPRQQQQHYTRLEKQKKENQLNVAQNNNKQKLRGKEQLKHQQTLHNLTEKVQTFQPQKFAQHSSEKENRTEENKNYHDVYHHQSMNQTKNGTALRPYKHHQLEKARQRLIQKTHTSKQTSAPNISYSKDCTTDYNCTSANPNVLGQNKTVSSNSLILTNLITDFFQDFIKASKVHSGKFKEIKLRTKTNCPFNSSDQQPTQRQQQRRTHREKQKTENVQILPPRKTESKAAEKQNRIRYNTNHTYHQPTQRQQLLLEKKHGKENLNQTNAKEKHFGKEELKQQKNQLENVPMLPHHTPEPKAEQHGAEKQNVIYKNKNNTYYQQTKEKAENRTKLHRHQQGQVQLQEKRISQQNASHSMNSTTDQNCSSANQYFAKQIKHGCRQNNSSTITNRIMDYFHGFLTASKIRSGAFEGRKKPKTNLHLNASHNYSAFRIQPHLSQLMSASPTKKLQNATLGNSVIITKPPTGLNAAKNLHDIKNISIQKETDLTQEKDFKTAMTQKLGPDVVELTEYVDRAPDKGNLTIKWSEWSPCSASCGNDARRKRTQYSCTSGFQEIRDCTVSGEQQETCASRPCPVDGWFTPWSHWGSCSRSCGFRGVSVRTRTCIPPSHGGRPCYGAGVKTRSCKRKHCPVNGGLSRWSEFGQCSRSCGGGVTMRHRQCNNPFPRYGGTECDQSDMFQTQSCGNMKCPVKVLKGLQVAKVDPKSLCDFNPCEEAGCLYDPSAKCITDFECNPVFFDAYGKMLQKCKGMNSLYSRIPDVICSFNPCISERCWEIRDQCVVDLKCRPIFIGIDKRSIPLQCQVRSTVRVDRIRWNTPSLFNKPAPVSLASDLKPSFTRLWFPVIPPPVTQPALRLSNDGGPLVLPRIFNTFSTMTNRKFIVHPSEQRLVTVEFEKPKSGAVYKSDDHDDDDDDDINNGNDGDDDDNEDNDDGYVHDDIDDDDF